MSTSRQRLYLDVPNPRAWFCLGQPDARGYRGVSFGADDNLFVSVKGQAFHQAKGSVQHVTMGSWYQGSVNDSVVNSGANALYTSKKQVLVVAGAGYSPDVQLELGDAPPAGYFNPLDYQEIVNPCRDGVRSYDTGFIERDLDFRELVGYPVNPLAKAAAAAGIMASIKASVLAFLFGTPPPATANSESIEQFARQGGGLLGVVSLVKRYTDRVERWTSRPDTLPLAGPVIAKLNTLKQAVNGLTKTYSQAEAIFSPSGAPRKGGIVNDYGQEVAEARKGVRDASKAYASGSNVDKVNAAVSYIALPRHLLRPVANQVRAVSNALQGLRNALDAVAEMARVKRRTSALALVGKEGVSLVSPRRVFGYAADGFHSISAPLGETQGDWLDKGAAWAKKMTDAIGLGVPPWPQPVPGFTVRSAGDIVMSSDGLVTTSAMGAGARMQMMSQGVAEFGALDNAALTARRGTAEVLGMKVVIGSAPKRVKDIEPKAIALQVPTELLVTAIAAFGPLRDTYSQCIEERDRLRREEQELSAQAWAANAPADILNPNLWAPLDAKRLQLAAAETAARAALVALQGAVSAAQQAREMRDTIEAAADAASLPQVSRALGWKAGKQSLADEVGIGGAKTVEIFSADKVEIGAVKKIELECKSALMPQATKLTMGAEIEISAGVLGTVKISVTSSGVSIKTEGTEITSSATSIELKAGPSKVTIGPEGIVVKGASITIDGAIANVG